jgi:hypothetical protein
MEVTSQCDFPLLCDTKQVDISITVDYRTAMSAIIEVLMHKLHVMDEFVIVESPLFEGNDRVLNLRTNTRFTLSRVREQDLSKEAEFLSDFLKDPVYFTNQYLNSDEVLVKMSKLPHQLICLTYSYNEESNPDFIECESFITDPDEVKFYLKRRIPKFYESLVNRSFKRSEFRQSTIAEININTNDLPTDDIFEYIGKIKLKLVSNDELRKSGMFRFDFTVDLADGIQNQETRFVESHLTKIVRSITGLKDETIKETLSGSFMVKNKDNSNNQ